MGLLDAIRESMERGAPLEELVKDLCWKDFEGFASDIFSENGFIVHRNVRFASGSGRRRYEIDVAAFQRPRVVLVDCKHWGVRTGKSSGIRGAAAKQGIRAHQFEGKLPEVFPEATAWERTLVIPVIVTLHQEGVIEHNGVFVAPIFKLNRFIEELRCGLFDGREIKVTSLRQFLGV